MSPTRGASCGALALVLALSAAACGDDETTAARPDLLRSDGMAVASTARAVLRDVAGAVVGHVELEDHDGATEVTVALEGLDATPGHHGFHVHGNDDPANGRGCDADPAAAPEAWFTAVDGHLHDAGQLHGDHRGDMPSVLVTAEGTATASFVTDRFAVTDLAGAAVVVHAGADNFGNVPFGPAGDQYLPNTPAALDATAQTGNAGPRIACGLVHPAP
jgi:Cu-Zn family superoxide dismutase